MLTAFGAVVVSLMMIFYALEQRSSWYTLAFAVACIVEGVWAIIAFRKWWNLYQTRTTHTEAS